MPDNSAADAKVRAILADWTGVEITQIEWLWSVSGFYRGAHHSAAGEDPVAVATHLDTVTKAQVGPPVEANPEPPPAAPPIPFDAKYGQPVVAAPAPPPADEPIPDALFVLVPSSVEEKARKKWLADRWIYLNALLLDGDKPAAQRRLPALKPSERVEFAALNQYMGWFS